MSAAVWIGVDGQFTARHYFPEDGPDAEPHWHTWFVTAWFDAPERADVRCYIAAVDALLDTMRGTVLPRGQDWDEDIVRKVKLLANCVDVEIRRPGDRSRARPKR